MNEQFASDMADFDGHWGDKPNPTQMIWEWRVRF